MEAHIKIHISTVWVCSIFRNRHQQEKYSQTNADGFKLLHAISIHFFAREYHEYYIFSRSEPEHAFENIGKHFFFSNIQNSPPFRIPTSRNRKTFFYIIYYDFYLNRKEMPIYVFFLLLYTVLFPNGLKFINFSEINALEISNDLSFHVLKFLVLLYSICTHISIIFSI